MIWYIYIYTKIVCIHTHQTPTKPQRGERTVLSLTHDHGRGFETLYHTHIYIYSSTYTYTKKKNKYSSQTKTADCKSIYASL